MATIEYPTLDPEQIDRQGKVYLRCDATDKNCKAEAEVVDISNVTRRDGRRTIAETFAPLPEGWVSSSENALDGAADFCPKHADRIAVVAPDEQPPPLSDG